MSRVPRHEGGATVGLLLAGGSGRRAGVDKRYLVLDGRTLLQRNLAFLRRRFSTVGVSLAAAQDERLRRRRRAWRSSRRLARRLAACRHRDRAAGWSVGPSSRWPPISPFPTTTLCERVLAAAPWPRCRHPGDRPTPRAAVRCLRARVPGADDGPARGGAASHRRDPRQRRRRPRCGFPTTSPFRNINTMDDFEDARRAVTAGERRRRRPGPGRHRRQERRRQDDLHREAPPRADQARPARRHGQARRAQLRDRPPRQGLLASRPGRRRGLRRRLARAAGLHHQARARDSRSSDDRAALLRRLRPRRRRGIQAVRPAQGRALPRRRRPRGAALRARRGPRRWSPTRPSRTSTASASTTPPASPASSPRASTRCGSTDPQGAAPARAPSSRAPAIGAGDASPTARKGPRRVDSLSTLRPRPPGVAAVESCVRSPQAVQSW